MKVFRYSFIIILFFPFQVFALDYIGFEFESLYMPSFQIDSKGTESKVRKVTFDSALLVPLELTDSFTLVNTAAFGSRNYWYDTDKKGDGFYQPGKLFSWEYTGTAWYTPDNIFVIGSGTLKSAYEYGRKIDRDTLQPGAALIGGGKINDISLGLGGSISGTSAGIHLSPLFYTNYSKGRVEVDILLPEKIDLRYLMTKSFNVGVYNFLQSHEYGLKERGEPPSSLSTTDLEAGVSVFYYMEEWLTFAVRAGANYYSERVYYEGKDKKLTVKENPSFTMKASVEIGY